MQSTKSQSSSQVSSFANEFNSPCEKIKIVERKIFFLIEIIGNLSYALYQFLDNLTFFESIVLLMFKLILERVLDRLWLL